MLQRTGVLISLSSSMRGHILVTKFCEHHNVWLSESLVNIRTLSEPGFIKLYYLTASVRLIFIECRKTRLYLREIIIYKEIALKEFWVWFTIRLSLKAMVRCSSKKQFRRVEIVVLSELYLTHLWLFWTEIKWSVFCQPV